MNTKMTIAAAALASLLLSTGAFAASEDYPASVNQRPAVALGGYVSTQSSEAYPGFSPALSIPGLSQSSLAMNNGSESAPESPNAAPRGFDAGTQQYADQQIQNRWFAQQAQKHYAMAQLNR